MLGCRASSGTSCDRLWRRFVDLLEHPAQHLARCAAWDLCDELDYSWLLVGSKSFTNKRNEFCCFDVGACFHCNDNRLTIDSVGDSEGGAIRDGRMPMKIRKRELAALIRAPIDAAG